MRSSTKESFSSISLIVTRLTTGMKTAWGATLHIFFVGILLTMAATETAADQLVVADFADSSVGSGSVGLYSTSGTPLNASLITGLFQPRGMVTDEQGNLFFTTGFGRIVEFSRTGAVIHDPLVSGLSEPMGLALDLSGHLFVTKWDPGQVGEYATSGQVINSALITGLSFATGIALDGTGHLFVANESTGVIGEYTTSGAPVNPSLITGLTQPVAIALDGTGHLFVCNSDYDGFVGEYTTSGQTVNPALIMNLIYPTSIAVDGHGHLFVGQGGTGMSRVGKYSDSGAVINDALISNVNATGLLFIFAPTRVVSRKVHGNSGTFDIDLPLYGTPGIESRSGGANSDYQLVFTFDNPVTFDSAVISDGTGSVSGTSGNGTSTVTVNLSGLANAQTIRVALLTTSDGANVSNFVVPMGILVGDTSGNGVVNASDLAKTKGQVGVPLNDHNFREDVTANGIINASDVALVKSASGTALQTNRRADR